MNNDKYINFSEKDIVYDPPEPGLTTNNFRSFLVGTRRVIRDSGQYRIVCATCNGGGHTPYRYRSEAIKAAIAQSIRSCTCKGCNAK